MAKSLSKALQTKLTVWQFLQMVSKHFKRFLNGKYVGKDVSERNTQLCEWFFLTVCSEMLVWMKHDNKQFSEALMRFSLLWACTWQINY
jgi:hypothetical protein